NKIEIVNEIKKGFISQFVLQCNVCKVEHTISTDKNDGRLNTNGAAVTGTISIGCGFSQVNEFESWDSMITAGREEARLAAENRDVDQNGITLIAVVADGAWCKRLYGTKYDAKSGAACIIGYFWVLEINTA
ncbi:hypothetical protein ILUMI_17580, partial [Ignelater luminosus]